MFGGFLTAERRREKKNVLHCHVVPLGSKEQKRNMLEWWTAWTALLKARRALGLGVLELVGCLEVFGSVYEKAVTQCWLWAYH